MDYNLFLNTSCLGDAYSFQASFKMTETSLKDTIKAKFIKYFNDETLICSNQIITGLLLLMTHDCKHCQSSGFTGNCREKSSPTFEVQFGTVKGKVMHFNIIEKKVT